MSATPQIERPPNPDDLPLVAERTPEDQALAAELGIDAHAAAVLTVPTYATVQTMTTASFATGGLESAHPNGTWTAGSGASAVDTPSPRRGFGGLFRGRSGGSSAS